MERFLTVVQAVAPIFAAILLGMLAKKQKMIAPEGVEGFQQFVMKIGLPCVIFNSCLTAKMGTESIGSMVFALLAVASATAWAFRARKRRYRYHNFPQLFAAQETGMLGIPLFIILFGADQVYRIGVLDLAQAIVAYPVIAYLSSDSGENPAPGDVVKKVLTSPFLIMSMLGLILNLSGVGSWLDSIGVGGILTDSAGFLAQPVSALMIFSVGYNFSLKGDCRKDIITIAGIHFGLFTVFGILIQLALFLVPGVDVMTRWTMLLYCMLPASYLAPTLGRSEKDRVMASGVCSVLTIASLTAFCVMAAVVV